MDRIRGWIRCCTVAGILVFAVQSDAAVGSRNQVFQVSRGGTLEVSVSVGDIRIIPWEKNEVSVRIPGLHEDEWEDFRILQDGNTVVVRGDGNAVRVEVSVPSQFNVDLDTSGGEIEISGALTGNLRGSTSGGDIRLGDVGTLVDMETSGGNIAAGKVTGDARLYTSGGNVDVQSAGGNLDVVTQGGNILIGNVQKSVKARSGGGTIEIGDVGGTATISTGGGDLIVGKVSGKLDLNTGGGSIEVGGGGGALTSRTGGGDIVLHDISGPIEAKTAGGDILAELIPAGKGPSRLISAGGNIELEVPSTSKATIEAVIRVRGRWSDALEESSIISDFEEASREEDSERKEIRATYVLNGGGERIYLETVNGTIEIRKK